MTLDERVAEAGRLADGDPENGIASQPDPAVAIYLDVLSEAPDHPGALYGFGIVLREAGRYALATQIAKRIVEVRPKDPRGYKLLSQIYGEQCKYEESIRYADKALACAVTDFTLADAAYAYCNAGEYEKAGDYAARALASKPSPLNGEAIRNAQVTKGYCDLAQGKWVEGFQGFRHMLRTKFRKEWTYGDSVEWNGEPNATVMVTGEQGLGDEIMAAGVITDAAKACERFIFDCDERLGALFTRSFPNVLVTATRRSKTVHLPVIPTHHKSLFGLGELFRKSEQDFHRRPFLTPNQEYVGMFRELFGGQDVIGLAWSGGLPRTGMVPRQAGLNAFLPLLRRGGEFVSLQYKDDAQEVAQFEHEHGIRVRRLPWVTQGQDMDLLAGLIAACKEVVGVHTTALHLSSAMGVPTTMLAHKASGWRYAPDKLLWYPETTNLFKKRPGESWRDCVTRLVESRK